MKTIDELLVELVGTPIEFVHLNSGVPEFKQALSTMVAEIVPPDYTESELAGLDIETRVRADAINRKLAEIRQRAADRGFTIMGER